MGCSNQRGSLSAVPRADPLPSRNNHPPRPRTPPTRGPAKAVVAALWNRSTSSFRPDVLEVGSRGFIGSAIVVDRGQDTLPGLDQRVSKSAQLSYESLLVRGNLG